MRSQIRNIVMAALMAALACVATMVIQIPSPMQGYINLGDCVVLVSGWMLPLGYGVFAAALGSLLADLFAGYAIYAPATFIIKGLMALIAFLLYRAIRKKGPQLLALLISGICAELLMAVGYFVFEGFLYGFGPSLVNIPANCIQGAAGLVFGILLAKTFEKSGILKSE